MAEFEIRPARAEDAAEIVRLIREGADRDVLDKLIYGCAGAARYVEWNIAAGLLGNRRYFVAMRGEEPAGCADFAVSGDALTLKYIAADGRFRRQGIGSALLRRGLEALGASRTWMELDVSLGNAAALRWYESLGFQPAGRSSYWEFTSAGAPEGAALEIPDWPQAQACHEAFGFSEFQLKTPAMSVRVGRVGDAWFRLPDAGAASSGAVRGALRAIDPARGIYAVLPEGSVTSWMEAHAKRVRSAQRMRARIAALSGGAARLQTSSPER